MGEEQRLVVSATAQMKATQSLISQSECMGHVGGPNSTMLELPSGGTRFRLPDLDTSRKGPIHITKA